VEGVFGVGGKVLRGWICQKGGKFCFCGLFRVVVVSLYGWDGDVGFKSANFALFGFWEGLFRMIINKKLDFVVLVLIA
jgi:hypothetical protein